MNKEKVKGAVDDAAGRAKRQIGEWTDNPNLQVEGAAQQVKGKAEKVVGNVKDAAKDTSNQMQKDHEHNEKLGARTAEVRAREDAGWPPLLADTTAGILQGSRPSFPLIFRLRTSSPVRVLGPPARA